MWGSWLTILLGGVLVLLLVIAIAFGTSALLFPVIIAALVAVGIAIAFVIKRGSKQMGSGAASVSGGPPSGSGRRPDGAPVSGEGSGAPTSATGRPRG
jgi:predicted lipid-binding transport protein (Tim44 family)